MARAASERRRRSSARLACHIRARLAKSRSPSFRVFHARARVRMCTHTYRDESHSEDAPKSENGEKKKRADGRPAACRFCGKRAAAVKREKHRSRRRRRPRPRRFFYSPALSRCCETATTTSAAASVAATIAALVIANARSPPLRIVENFATPIVLCARARI